MANEQLLKDIGNRIKARRKELKITQAELSYSCSTDPSYIRKVESGKVNISILNLQEITSALEISLSDFLQDI